MTTPRAHHVGITVSDIESVLPFYRDILEFDVLDRFSVSGEAFADAVDVPDAAGTFAHLEAGDVRIELVEYAPTGTARKTPELNHPGATHVGFSVPDIEAFFASLPAEVETLSEPRTTESGTSILFLRDPEENLVEVLER
ncbi:VOC family protein [Natronosalvus halobius]|uniref:VOC family protein n=1 Tax=Natronosalvus halobius TaxID=2953746 RepID=UPI0020A0F280|nr:VOC family protein [Natronosalvus halobius]USZ71932.1 VOC family protein [Natronosalvus halobius]